MRTLAKSETTRIRVRLHSMPTPYEAGYNQGKEDALRMILSAMRTLSQNCRGFNGNEMLSIISNEVVELLGKEGALS